jgi:hypothetical protein
VGEALAVFADGRAWYVQNRPPDSIGHQHAMSPRSCPPNEANRLPCVRTAKERGECENVWPALTGIRSHWTDAGHMNLFEAADAGRTTVDS